MSETGKLMAAIEAAVKALAPLESEERRRAIDASLVILGEKSSTAAADTSQDQIDGEIASHLPMRARQWVNQNGISLAQLQHVFDVSNGQATVIAPSVVGKNNADKTIKAYILAGLASFITNGEPNFDDKAGRAICENFGCYDNSNHSRYVKVRGNYFTGSKASGWKLTAPGLKYGAILVKELGGAGE